MTLVITLKEMCTGDYIGRRCDIGDYIEGDVTLVITLKEM